MHRANISLLVLSDPLSASQTSLDELPISSAIRLANGAVGIAPASAPASGSHESLGNGAAHQATKLSSITSPHQSNMATANTQNAHCSQEPARAETTPQAETSSMPGPVKPEQQDSYANAQASSADLAQKAAVQSPIGSRQPLPKPCSAAQQFQAMPQTPEERLALLKYEMVMPLLCLDA